MGIHNRISAKRLAAAYKIANMCPEKGRRFKRLVEQHGLRHAYELAVKEAFDGKIASGRVPVHKFHWYDVTCTLENIVNHHMGRYSDFGVVFSENDGTATAAQFLRRYPYQKVLGWIIKAINQ